MNPLPTIHPLRADGEGPARGPNGECLCNHCRHWSPLLTHIRYQLDEEGMALLSEYVSYSMQTMEDNDVELARFNGDWPGWESLKGFSPWTHKVVEMTEAERAAVQARMQEGESL